MAAKSPNPRYDSRLVYLPATTHSILFGGVTGTDFGTRLAWELNDTWDFNGVRWTQLYPANVPTARSGHVMVYDSARQRIVMFGGRTKNGTVDLNDTWFFKNGNWTQIDTPDAPPARALAGGAYDPIRDRVVVTGGAAISSDGKTSTPFYDTWEFDGTTWRKIINEGPHALRPNLAFDAARGQTVMLAVDDKAGTHQYIYDPGAPFWNEVTSTSLPTCANGGALVYQGRNQTLFYTGGFCTGSSATEDDVEWDGSKWNIVTVKTNVGRLFGEAMTYDEARQQVVLFGGSNVSGTTRNDTWTYNGDWTFVGDPSDTPGARNLFVFATDPTNNAIWLYGGVDPAGDYLRDLWKYQYGRWDRVNADNAPTLCGTPTSAYDSDRQTLVIVCSDSTVWEWNGTAWKNPTGSRNTPQSRRLSSMTYDQSLKKSVLFGGYVSNYIDETWTWDGTQWQQDRKNLPPPRIEAAMWFDPVLKKTVIFGGLGRQNSQDRTARFNDMWQYEGNGWTEIKPTTLPPPRYGAQVAVDPRTNTVLMFGGLRVDTVDVPATPTTPATTKEVQVYADDFWQWDGHDWKQVTFPRVPYARENGGMAWDPTNQTMVVFGGFANNNYLSDLWVQGDNGWMPVIQLPIRRRSAAR